MKSIEQRTHGCAVAIATFAAALALEHHNDSPRTDNFTQLPDLTILTPTGPLAQLGTLTNNSAKGPYHQQLFYGVSEGEKITKLRMFKPEPGKHQQYTATHGSKYEDIVLIYSHSLSKELKTSVGMVDPNTERAILLTSANAGSQNETIISTRLEFDKHSKRVTYVGGADFIDHANANVLPSNRIVKALGYTITGNLIHRQQLLGVDLRVDDRKSANQSAQKPHHAPTPPKAPLPGSLAPIPPYPLPNETIHI
jgi:hypothetical protein